MFDLLPIESLTMLLAQEGPPPLPGEGEPLTTPGGNGTQAPQAGGGFGFIFTLMLLFLGMMLIMSIMGQRKERKKREALIASIKKHDKVQTIGGVVGTIMELKPETVVLKVDESSNTRITFARSAIQQVLKSSDATAPAAVSDEGLKA